MTDATTESFPFPTSPDPASEDPLTAILRQGARRLLSQAVEAESEQSWKTLLLDAKHRGLTVEPKLATGDGALGFWKALPQVFPATRTQRCWVHKTVDVLDKLPKRQHGEAKDRLHQIWMAATRDDAEQAFNQFIETYQAKYLQGRRMPE